MNSACVFMSPLASYFIFGHYLCIFMYGKNWFVESLSHIASISPVIMYVDYEFGVRSKCFTVVERVFG